jgi:hypothetical protein
MFMLRPRYLIGLCALCVIVLLGACDPSDNTPDPADRTQFPTATSPPTPAEDTLHISGTTSTGARLQVTLPSVQLLQRPADASVQVFVVLAAPQGTYSYMLFPANSQGHAGNQFNLMEHPLEISLDDRTPHAYLWILAIENQRYQAAEQFGLDALAASLGFGFHNWLAEGDPADDPLAAIISASEGALYNWYASIEVLGQTVIPLDAEQTGMVNPISHTSEDGGLTAVYATRYISAQTVAQLPTPTPPSDRTDYVLRVDETFDGGTSENAWYVGQDSTYANTIIDGAYEIQLTDITQREFGLSWGSIEGQQFENYLIEAEVSLLETGVKEARYGIWFHYQDDYNFAYFGVSNQGEYRAAVIQRNKNLIELQDWTPHPAVRRGAATNVLTIETASDGDIRLGINGEHIITVNNQVFTSGSVAFFCYAESVPTTCHLNRLRIWEREE